MPHTGDYGLGSRRKRGKVEKVMHEYKHGELHSGRGGPVVTARKQAVAIAMSESGQSRKRRKRGGRH